MGTRLARAAGGHPQGGRPWHAGTPLLSLLSHSAGVWYSARHDTNSGQKKKVKYFAHPCSVCIVTLVGKSHLLFPSPFGCDTHISIFLILGYNSSFNCRN